MRNSPLRNKSEILASAAELLHDKSYYLAVAHAAYYSCYQLMKHIWLYPMGRTEDELGSNISSGCLGSHQYLLNEIVKHIRGLQSKKSKEDARCLRNDIPQLKRLRTDADYKDTDFDSQKSEKSIALSKKILSILKEYSK